MIRLAPGTYLRLLGGQGYAMQLKSGKSFLFNETVFDLLTAVRDHPGLSQDELCRLLLEEYDVPDPETFRRDIAESVRDLTVRGLLVYDPDHSSESPVWTPEDRLNHLCMERHLLESVTLELTYRCNERCAHCYVGDAEREPEAELSSTEIFKLMDQMRDMGVLNLTLTGGEVAMREDFMDILRYAVRSGFVVSVYSNGIGFREEDLDEIAALKPRSVSFSLYSGDPAEHDGITRVSGSFERTLYAMMRLKCAGIMINVKTPVMRPAVGGFEKLHTMCRRLGFSHQVSYLICSTNKGCASPTQLRLGDPELYRRLMAVADDGPDPGPIVRRDPDGPVCGACGCCLSVNPYGIVYPCNGYALEMGNIRQTPLKEIWEGDRVKAVAAVRFRDLGEKCLQCDCRDDCLYCPGAMRSETGDPLTPLPETCVIARAVRDTRLRREARQKYKNPGKE